jgi:nicotinamide mononucleotide (NMN) deamidase PncC
VRGCRHGRDELSFGRDELPDGDLSGVAGPDGNDEHAVGHGIEQVRSADGGGEHADRQLDGQHVYLGRDTANPEAAAALHRSF